MDSFSVDSLKIGDYILCDGYAFPSNNGVRRTLFSFERKFVGLFLGWSVRTEGKAVYDCDEAFWVYYPDGERRKVAIVQEYKDGPTRFRKPRVVLPEQITGYADWAFVPNGRDMENPVLIDMVYTVLIEGGAVNPGVYTCIWNGDLNGDGWEVIITECDIPDDTLDLIRELAIAIEGVVDKGADDARTNG